MVASLLHLRNFIGALSGYGNASEPVLFKSSLGSGAQWPCGCRAVGTGFEQLEIALCQQHRGTWLADVAAAPRKHRAKVDRRQAPSSAR
jgi:hypothetical protein